MNKLIPFGFLCLLAAIGALAFHLYIRNVESSVKDWPTASAVIRFLPKSFAPGRHTLKEPLSLISTAPNRDPAYQNVDVWALDIDYAYTVNGEPYTGYSATSIDHVSIVRPGESSPSEDIVDLGNKLTAGETLSVHYNPNRPDESYLIYMESPGNKTILTTAWVLAAIGIVLIAVPYIAR